jgi:putative flippase GtrA
MTLASANETKRSNRVAETRKFAGFAVTGGFAAVCNVASRIFLSHVVRYEIAVTFAYLIGMIVAFVLARTLVFEASQQPWRTELLKFAAVNLVSFAQVWLVSVGLVRLVFPWLKFHWHPESTAHVIGVASPILFSYYAHRRFTFRPATK